MADNKKQTAKEKSKDAAQAANLAFIQQLMSQDKNVEVVAGDAPEDAAPQEQPQDDVPQQEQAAEAARDQASAEEPVAEEPAAPEEEMDQDAIDAMMAARAAKKAGGAQEETSTEEPVAEEPAAPEEEMDQDAIDAMMAARAAKKAGGAQEEAPAEEQAAAEEPAADEEMDQDAIDAMMAARAAKKSGGQQEPAEEPKEAELDQSAIDAMMAARTAKKTSEPEPQEEEKEAEVDQDAIDAMMAQRAQAKKAGPKASAKPKEEPQAKAADSEEDGIPVGFMAKLKVAQGSHALRKLSLAHLLFLSNGLLVVVILVGLLFFLSRKSNQPRTVIAEVAVPADSNHSGPATVEPRKLVIPEVGPTTWTEAERAFAARKWDLAFARYQKLMEDAQSTWENQMVIDLLRMRSGQCLIRLSQIDLGREMLVRSTRSASPIVRAYSNYRLGKLRSTQGLHMQARTRSFMAVAALGMLDMPSPLEVDCDYLIARCMTEKVLSYHNPDRDIPTPRHEEYDPFVGLSEGDLVRFLSEGAQRLNRSVLGPVVKLVPPGDNLNASCWRAPLKEYLHRFEAETGIDVRWVNVSPDARRRPVTVYLDKVSFERAAEVGTGVVGLVSRLSGATVEVHDVQAEESMGQTRSLIREEAISAWRQFFLRQPEDVRVPSGRLSLARIYEAGDDALAAIREYQLIASRFPRHLAAPEAIMRSAQLRIRMLDYPGARKDLIKLLDTYPDYEATDDLYLSLGRASLNAGMFEEAVGVFRKLYYLNLSPESQAGACLGLGKCYFGQKNYVEAARWLKRYLKQTYKTSGDELCEAMELMGKCHMAQGDPKRAVQYLLPAVSMDSSLRRDISATLTLAEAAMADENYVRAVGAVDRIDTQRVPDEQMYDFLRIKADVYSGMGLYRRALRTLRQGIDNTQNSRMRARLGYQMARNYIRASEYPMAHAVLTEVLGSGKLAPGAESQNAAVDLGEVCMLMDRPDQAISAVRSVAAASEDKKLRRRASKVLGAAYVMKQEYDKAAMAYAGQLPQQKGVSQP